MPMKVMPISMLMLFLGISASLSAFAEEGLRGPTIVEFQCEPDVQLKPQLRLNSVEFNLADQGFHLSRNGAQIFLVNNQSRSSLLLGALTQAEDLCGHGAVAARESIELDSGLRMSRDEDLGICKPTIGFTLWAPGIDWYRSVHARYEFIDFHGNRAALEATDKLYYRSLSDCRRGN